MADYIPDEVLPIYPTYTTIVKDGVKYKAYFETDWHQVITEDGVPLCDLIQSMPSFSSTNFYRYRGTFRSTPESSAIDKLYAVTTQVNGDVYLVETDMITSGGRVCEAYVWLGNEAGWVYCGTTDRKSSINRDLPNVVKLMPSELGEPGQILVVSEDGKSIAWGEADVEGHNADPTAHQDIRNELNLKADKLVIFNDVLDSDMWVYNGEYPAFEYIYKSDKLPKNSYFEMTPVVDNKVEASIVANASISPIYRIKYNSIGEPYTILRAKHVPNADIMVCIKAFGTFEEK